MELPLAVTVALRARFELERVEPVTGEVSVMVGSLPPGTRE